MGDPSLCDGLPTPQALTPAPPHALSTSPSAAVLFKRARSSCASNHVSMGAVAAQRGRRHGCARCGPVFYRCCLLCYGLYTVKARGRGAASAPTVILWFVFAVACGRCVSFWAAPRPLPAPRGGRPWPRCRGRRKREVSADRRAAAATPTRAEGGVIKKGGTPAASASTAVAAVRVGGRGCTRRGGIVGWPPRPSRRTVLMADVGGANMLLTPPSPGTTAAAARAGSGRGVVNQQGGARVVTPPLHPGGEEPRGHPPPSARWPSPGGRGRERREHDKIDCVPSGAPPSRPICGFSTPTRAARQGKRGRHGTPLSLRRPLLLLLLLLLWEVDARRVDRVPTGSRLSKRAVG